MKKIIITSFFVIGTFLPRAAFAQTSNENPATPEVFTEPGAKLLITEVNLKNKTNDWVELYYESPTHKPFNIKNFGFQDDTVFKKITSDYWINSGEYYVLEFKTADADNQTAHLLTTTRTGLTATTEQIIFIDPSGKIMDALCWASASPTADEVKDMQELFEGEGWVSANASSCFSSAKISTNQSLIRINMMDTDSMNDWTVTDDLTAGKANNAPADNTAAQQTQTGTTSAAASTSSSAAISTTAAAVAKSSSTESTNEPPADADTEAASNSEFSFDQLNQPAASSKASVAPAPSAKKTSAPKKTSTAAKKSTAKAKKPAYKNGDLSDSIIISELFPHPAADQRNNEWIELMNTGNDDVNLGNWQVDDEDGGSKPYILPDTVIIPAQSALVIKITDSKLSFSDTKDQVRLFDPDGKLLQTVGYEEAPKEQSYAWITIMKEDGSTEQQWFWETSPTAGEPNQNYQELTGTVTSEPEFGETYRFTIQTADQKQYTLIFNEALIAGPMAKAAFVKGAQIKILGDAAQSPATDGSSTQEATGQIIPELQLKQYEIIGAAPPAAQEPSSPWVFLGLLPPGSAGFWYGLKKIRKIYGKI